MQLVHVKLTSIIPKLIVGRDVCPETNTFAVIINVANHILYVVLGRSFLLLQVLI